MVLRKGKVGGDCFVKCLQSISVCNCIVRAVDFHAGICASVCASIIRYLRIFGPVQMDSEIDSMINTICTS